MTSKKVEAAYALDRIVMERIQHFEDIHFRTECYEYTDPETGDEFITVYDPQTDQCLTLWYSPSWYGNDFVEMVKAVIAEKVKGGNHAT